MHLVGKANAGADRLEKLRALCFAGVDTRPQEDGAAPPPLENEVGESDSASRPEEEGLGVGLAGMARFNLLEVQNVPQGGKLGVAAAELRVTLYNQRHLPIGKSRR